MESEVQIDLSDLSEIMEMLPDPPPGLEARKNVLTKNDLIIIAKIVKALNHTNCAMGFTNDEITTIKKVVGTINKGILAVGYSILAALGAGLVSIVWWTIKHGIIDIANKGAK